MKQRILFVDDESYVLQGLKRSLRSVRHDWDMVFVTSGDDALQTLAEERFDVVVADMCMPGMDGVQLLDEVMQRYPRIIRIVLSGQSEKDQTLKAVGATHQYLTKPCDVDILKTAVNRACTLREQLANDVLQSLVSRMEKLPSVPSLYLEIVQALRTPDSSVTKIGQIISRDMGMTAKILQLVNSAYFGLPRNISDPIHAAKLLGLETIKALVLTVQIFSQFEQSNLGELDLNMLWKHSVTVGSFAKLIAKVESLQSKTVDEAFTAGLLHDVGKLVLASNLCELYDQTLVLVKNKGLTCWQAETETFGATHSEVGGYLLGLWGLPHPIVEAVTYHHHPKKCSAPEPDASVVVHIANFLEHQLRSGHSEHPIPLLDVDYLSEFGLVDRLSFWKEQCKNSKQKELRDE